MNLKSLGDSSEIIVDEALKFIGQQVADKKPFFTVIWYGTPHSPWMALDKDQEPFGELSEKSQKHYAELVAMDRSMGALRKGLKKLNVAKDTLVWFTSDNGGLPDSNPPQLVDCVTSKDPCTKEDFACLQYLSGLMVSSHVLRVILLAQ